MAGAASGLEKAFIASLALHGAVLAGASFPEFHAESSAPAPLAARLAEPAPVADAPVEEKREQRPVAPAPLAKTAPVKKLVPQAVEPAPKAEPVRAGEVFSPPAAVPAPAAQPVSIAVTPADPGLIGQYRALLLGAAGRYKRYPDEARENNWTGNVAVTVAIDANGAPQVGLRRGSGHAVLDQQALGMFRQAARAVPLPEALRGREFSLELRAVYGLED